jgi:hypothetical protein
MSINPSDPNLIELHSVDGNYHVIGCDESDLGRVEYIPSSISISSSLPGGWKKVEMIVDGIRSQGFVNLNSNKFFSIKEKIDTLQSSESELIITKIITETEELPETSKIELIAELLIKYKERITSYPDELSTNYQLCLAVVKKDPSLLKNFSEAFKESKPILLEALKKDPSIIMSINAALLVDPDFLPYLNYPELLAQLKECSELLTHKANSLEASSNSDLELSFCLRNLANFCGLSQAHYQGVSLERLSTYTATSEIANILESPIEGFSDAERIEFKEAFEKASNSELLNSKTVEKIREGNFVVIPVGLIGHSVSVIFSGNHFAICNRGFGNEMGIIKLYEYDPSKMSLEILSYLIANYSHIYPDLSSALEHQNTYLYQNLPLILEGIDINPKTPSPSFPLQFKDQKMENCAKASHLTGLKVGIYLKLLENGKPKKRAAILAKQIGKKISFALREKIINNALIALTKAIERGSITEKDQNQAVKLIEKAKAKLERSKLIDSL